MSRSGYSFSQTSDLSLAEIAALRLKEAEKSRSYSNYTVKNEVVAYIKTSDVRLVPGNPSEGQRGYVNPFALGRFSVKRDTPFVQLKAFVDRVMADVPKQDLNKYPGSPSGFIQVRPASLVFTIGEKQVKKTKTTPRMSSGNSWSMVLPAFGSDQPKNQDSINPSSEDNFHLKFTADISAVSSSLKTASARSEFDSLRKASDSVEQERLDSMLSAGQLHYVPLRFKASHLAKSNSFLDKAEFVPHLIANFQHLYSPEVADTELTLHCFFGGSPSNVHDDLTRLRNAQILENSDREYFDRIWGKSPARACKSEKGDQKDLEDLPVIIVRPPLVCRSIKETFFNLTLDRHHMSSFAQDANSAVSQYWIKARFCELKDGPSQKIGIFFLIPPEFPRIDCLRPGDIGTFTFKDQHNIKPWTYRVAEAPTIAGPEDVFAVSDRPEDAGTWPTELLKSEGKTQTGLLSQLLASDAYDRVNVIPRFSSTTERQQNIALQKASPFTTNENKQPEIAAVMAPLLAGHNMEMITEKSIFSDDLSKKLSDADKLSTSEHDQWQKFKTKVSSILGISMSTEQEDLVTDYLLKFPSDNVGLLEGGAGTAKSTSAALAATFVLEDGGKQFLVLTEMHAIANQTAKTFKHVVETLTNRKVIRDFGAKYDLAILKYILEGRPKRLRGVRWNKDLTKAECASKEFQELLNLVDEALRCDYGTTDKRYHSAAEMTFAWHIVQDMGLDKETEDKSRDFRESLPFFGPITEEQSELHELITNINKDLGCYDRSHKPNSAAINAMKAVRKRQFPKFAGIVTTVSQTEEVLESLTPGFVVVEESHCLSVHNAIVVNVALTFTPKLYIFDPEQLGPYRDDTNINGFADVRQRSFSVIEDLRGRRKATLQESRRMGPTSLHMPSKLFYGGELQSSVSNHPLLQTLLGFHRKVLGAKARGDCPHLLVNVPNTTALRIGPKKSTVNEEIFAATRYYKDELQRWSSEFPPNGIGFVTPYAAQEASINKAIRQWPQDQQPGGVGTYQKVMGSEYLITINITPKMDGAGILDMHGMLAVAFTRAKLATIWFVDWSALEAAMRLSKAKDSAELRCIHSYLETSGCIVTLDKAKIEAARADLPELKALHI